jgi:hypothetical protein
MPFCAVAISTQSSLIYFLVRQVEVTPHRSILPSSLSKFLLFWQLKEAFKGVPTPYDSGALVRCHLYDNITTP